MFVYGDCVPNWQNRIVQLFEKNTYSVVNIFDVTLRPQLNVTGAVEVLFHKNAYNHVILTIIDNNAWQ